MPKFYFPYAIGNDASIAGMCESEEGTYVERSDYEALRTAARRVVDRWWREGRPMGDWLGKSVELLIDALGATPTPEEESGKPELTPAQVAKSKDCARTPRPCPTPETCSLSVDECFSDRTSTPTSEEKGS